MHGVKLSIGATEDGRHGVLVECDDEELARNLFDLLDAKLQESGTVIYDTDTDNN